MHKAQTTITPLALPGPAVGLHEFQAVVEEQRQFRLDQLNELADAAASSPAALDEVIEILRVNAETALSEVERALDRMRAGSYGICERCTRKIAYGQLEILPMSRYCMTCQRDQNRPR